MNPQAYMMELMLRAPACPDGFQPVYPAPEYSEGEGAAIDSGVPTFRYLQFQRECKVKRLIEWPSFWAKQVMEAAEQKTNDDNLEQMAEWASVRRNSLTTADIIHKFLDIYLKYFESEMKTKGTNWTLSKDRIEISVTCIKSE